MKTINRDKIQRMIGQVAGGGSGGYSSGGDSIITPSWLDENYVAIPYWENLFEAVGTKTTTVGSGTPTTVDYTFDTNEKPETKTTTEGGVTTTVKTVVTGVKVKPHYLTGLLGINKTLYFDQVGTSYNVGIGVAAPDEKFHVNGNSKLWGNIFMHGAISGLTNIDGLLYVENARVGIGVSYPSSKLHVSGNVTANNFIAGTDNGSYIKIGDIYIEYDYQNGALKVYKQGGVANLYATGAVSALGSNTSGGGGGGLDVEAMWEELGSNTGTYGSSQINPSHLSTNFYTKAQVNNLLQEMSGFVKSVKVGSDAAVPPDANGLVTLPGFLKLTGGTVTGQITSSLATGTAPLAVTSTTLCTNLNADKLDGYDASGLFEVLKNSTESGHTNDIEVKTGNTTKYLTVGYASKAGQLKTSVTLWGNSFNGSNSIGVLGTPAALNYVSDINGLMCFDLANNRVGIGTNSPGYKLHVDGSSFLDGQVGIGGFTTSNYKLYVNGTTYLNGNTGVNGNVTLGSSDGTYIKIGDIYIEYDYQNGALKVYKQGGVANFYATGAVSALGSNTSGGGGGGGMDEAEMWASLGSDTGTYGGSQINISHLSTALSGYATTNELADYIPLAGSASVGANGLAPATNDTALGSSSHRWDLYATAGNFSGAVSASSVSTGGLTVGYATKLSGGAKLTNICIETDRDGNYSPQFPYAHEINDFTSALNLNYSTTNPVTVCQGKIVFKHQNGWSYIETDDPNDDDLEIHVNQLYVRTEDGFFGNNSYNLSDIRLKDIIDYPSAPLEMIANAPIFNFRWKDGNEHEHLGTSAQYWEDIFAKATHTMANGYLAMDYGAVALASAVMTAREIVRLESEVKKLKEEIEKLKES